ncbi:MAG TPA: hypothetical protein PKU78_06585 [Candidatus Dojkabacteria bacterium]|nr:hypothetical protein [Candidatus Dojkabacteria bacterium]
MPEDTDGYFGFVYLITRTNALPGERRFYIGCKQFQSKTKRPPLKGYKRKRTIIKESNYKSYYGSSNELLSEIDLHGKQNFKREVLHLATCKWELKYLEMLEQVNRKVLFDDSYFNGIVNLRIGKCPKNLRQKYGF